MEPISTAVIISTIVSYLAKSLKDNKNFEDFTKDFTSATINWIRPIFLKDDGTPKEFFKELKVNPESENRLKTIDGILRRELEDTPNAEIYLKEIYDSIKAKEAKGENISISKNVITGNINTSGNIHLGDGGTTSIGPDKN